MGKLPWYPLEFIVAIYNLRDITSFKRYIYTWGFDVKSFSSVSVLMRATGIVRQIEELQGFPKAASLVKWPNPELSH